MTTISTLVLGLGTAGWATDPASVESQPSSVTPAVVANGSAQDEVVVADEAEVAEVREEALEARQDKEEPRALRDLRAELTRSAAENGETLLMRDTEAFEISDQVQVAVAAEADVELIEVTIDENSVVAEVTIETDGDPLTQGQGMGWTIQSSGTFIIKLVGKGEMESRYIRSRYTGDGPDLSSIRRKALGRGYQISGLDWSVTGMYVSSHVVDADKQWVNGRYKSAPEATQDGDCNDTGLTLDILFLSWSFIDCNKVEINWNSADPGYYAAYMKQGAVFGTGSREVGFHNVVKVAAGKNVRYTNYQRLEMARYIYKARWCSSWDQDASCSDDPGSPPPTPAGTTGAYTPAPDRAFGRLGTHMGDFNGDGKQDLLSLRAGDNAWMVSFGGTSLWTEINGGYFDPSKTYVGDINGDGKDDLVSIFTDGSWRVSWSATSLWANINPSGWGVPGRTWVADMNGDGGDDLFLEYNGDWATSNDGPINGGAPLDPTRTWFTDINGDGKADVFSIFPDGRWMTSFSGRSLWTEVNGANIDPARTWMGDLNGDGKSDLFYIWEDNTWLVSYGATGPFVPINGGTVNLEKLWIADMNGDGRDDVFTIMPNGPWLVSYSGTSAFVEINGGGLPSQL